MTNIETIRKFAAKLLINEEVDLGAPLVIDEITFVPIVKHVIPREERDYLSLSEALEEGVCKIIDKGTEVAHILFENLGDLPILIEEGEIFQGKGTQDRISIGTVMVEPMATVEIAVKCVHAPHHLSSGAAFKYGGKASRGMLNEIRTMKFNHAVHCAPASHIDQSRVWSKVREENIEEGVSDTTKYVESVEKRSKRAKKRTEKLNFPKNTIGMVVVNPKGDVKGLEIHRSPHNFRIRKDRIFESLETNISWKPEGKGPYQNAQEKVKKLFKEISELKEGKDALRQVEIDGLAINMAGVSGEAYTTTFYSAVCPSCNSQKPRKKACPHCGFLEEESDEIAYMSMY